MKMSKTSTFPTYPPKPKTPKVKTSPKSVKSPPLDPNPNPSLLHSLSSQLPMETTIVTTATSTLLPFPNTTTTTNLFFPTNPFFNSSKRPQKLSVTANFSTKNHHPNPKKQNPFAQTIKLTAKTLTFTLAAALMAAKLCHSPAKAETLAPTGNVVEEQEKGGGEDLRRESGVEGEVEGKEENPSVTLSSLEESNEGLVRRLKDLLEERLKDCENDEALVVLDQLVEAQGEEIEWKFVKARLLSEMGRIHEARLVFEEILAVNPLCFEALFENAVIMERCGEGEAVLGRLEEALRVAEGEEKAKEARDVRFIMAQVQFLQKNVDGALRSYDELVKEDPNDFRPYFCKGMIYSLLDRNEEAKEQFDKYRELSPKKGEVEGYLKSSLSRMKLFGGDN